MTAICGSGPAYIFFVVESMIEAGVHLGLPRATATELVVQTLVGSAKMLRETGTHPIVLREQVTSPGGTTAAALRELEIHKVRAAFLPRWRRRATVRARWPPVRARGRVPGQASADRPPGTLKDVGGHARSARAAPSRSTSLT